mgnify:CR=1 FL=1
MRVIPRFYFLPMKKLLIVVGMIALVALVPSPFGRAIADQEYSSCRALRVDFPEGIAASDKSAWRIPEFRRPRVIPVLYGRNLPLDANHDGLMCERA